MSATSDATLKPTSLPAHCHIIEDTSACYSVSRLHDNTPRSSTVSIIDNGSVSKHVYYDFMQYSLYVQFGLVLLGILTNVCSITVFTRKQMKSATSTILTFLSCSELGVAIVELIMVSFSVAMGHMAYTSHIFWTLFRWCRVYLTIVFQRCSFCFNILVATERFIVVRFPLKAKQILRRRNPVIFCAVISATIFGINTFNPLKMEVVPVHTKRGMIYTIQNSQLYTNDPDTFEVLSVFTKIIFSYIPLFGCLLMNILMVTALLNNRKERKRMQTNRNAEHLNDRREIHTTVTILVSTFLFVLLSLPVTTTSIVESTNPEYGEQKREHYLFRFLVQFNGLLYLLSLSMDFLVYMILSRAFRQTFIHLLRSTSCHHASGIVEGHTSATRSIKLSRNVSSRVETSMSVPRHKVAEDVDRENTVTEELGSSVNVTDGFGVTVETEAL
ncbi:uncharacterized protein LOC121369699 [Gigantopelta aegis]|uniref:uncharacterized protein LOC121369699 n=1 Tax=Gigantopelta aegis TaxID=1735272 RepID=UPI001B88D9F4|nr:uncharacterized protein LOC121369699 [Gigantopelta aegis]